MAIPNDNFSLQIGLEEYGLDQGYLYLSAPLIPSYQVATKSYVNVSKVNGEFAVESFSKTPRYNAPGPRPVYQDGPIKAISPDPALSDKQIQIFVNEPYLMLNDAIK